MREVAIKAENVSKCFKIYPQPYWRLFEWFSLGRLSKHKEFWALRDINLELYKGESLGIVGPNGAGKSTLLKILTGSLHPSTGSVSIHGRVVSLLELGTGFHPELTGLQNIYNSANLLGFDKGYISNKINDIIDFSGIGQFIDKPIKTYSSGMYVRLAFSLFANLDPDIYIVDEALAVGDVFFQQKCYTKLQEMKDRGVTIILVSHDPAPIINFCSVALTIDSGKIIDVGQPAKIMELYQAREYTKLVNDEFNEVSSEKLSFGNQKVSISDAYLADLHGTPRNVYTVTETVKLKVSLNIEQEINDLIIGFQIKNRFGSVVYGTNTNWLHKKIVISDSKCVGVVFTFPANLGVGKYTVSIAAAEDKRNPEIIYTWKENYASFEIQSELEPTFGGETYLPIEVEQVKS